MLSIKRLSLSCLTTCFLCLHIQALAMESAEEYEIKAIYLFNLGKFITWPEEDPLQQSKPFEICILGQDPFGINLDFVVQTQKVIQKRQVLINRLSATTSLNGCHILFISDVEQLRLSNILAKLKNKPILTVSDSESFITQGGMIQFYRNNDKIRMMLQPQAINEAGLKASSRLLSIVKIISR